MQNSNASCSMEQHVLSGSECLLTSDTKKCSSRLQKPRTWYTMELFGSYLRRRPMQQ